MSKDMIRGDYVYIGESLLGEKYYARFEVFQQNPLTEALRIYKFVDGKYKCVEAPVTYGANWNKPYKEEIMKEYEEE